MVNCDYNIINNNSLFSDVIMHGKLKGGKTYAIDIFSYSFLAKAFKLPPFNFMMKDRCE